MRKIIVGVLALAVVIVGMWIWQGNTSDENSSLIQVVNYTCDGGKNIVASYFESSMMLEQYEEGEMPVPTGSVDISLDGGEKMTLAQTIAASGIRYANEDESLVFWSKGDEAFVMWDEEVDPDYTNCTVVDVD